MSGGRIKPVLQAVLLFDRFYVDAATGKKVIAGTFNKIASPKFPSLFVGGSSVFVSMTDFHGDGEIKLALRCLSDSKLVMEVGLRLRSTDPLGTVEVAIQLPPIRFHREGVYSLDVLWGQEILGALRIQAIKEDENEH